MIASTWKSIGCPLALLTTPLPHSLGQELPPHPWELKGWGWARCKEQFSLVQLVFIRHRQWGT